MGPTPKNDRKTARGPVKLWDILGRITPLKFNIDTETKKTFLKGDRYTFQTTISFALSLSLYNVHIAFIKGVTIGKFPGPLQYSFYIRPKKG